MPTLDWMGKDKVVNHHLEVPYRVLERQYSFDSSGKHQTDNNSDNMIIHGDNLEALKALLPKYEGKVKCIYIDPPYNTGNENWVYNDNVNDPQIKKWLGKVVGKEGEDLSRHDKWLCMMYPRLKLLRQLLADDGAIFISIDNNEQANLKLICDEIFGSNNFISEIACVNKPSGRSDDKYVATAHEYILVYKNGDNVKFHGFEPEENIIKRYTKIDDNRRKYREEDLRKRGTHDTRDDRPNLFYPFFYNQITNELSLEYHSQTDEWIPILPMKTKKIEGTWRWGKETAQKQLKYLHARYMPNKGQWSIFEWQYLDERGAVKPTSVWNFKDVNSERGTELFRNLGFNTKQFPNSKPLGTIKRVLEIATDKDAIVLDSFAGSGTTAHAVLNLNAEDGGHRKFILIELMDYADSITAERVKRVIQGYGEGKKAVAGTGGDFSFYELGEPLLVDGMLNPKVSQEKIYSYVYYMETKQPFVEDEAEPYKLGVYHDTAYYFYYVAGQSTILDDDFLNMIQTRAEYYIIYADTCLLSEQELERYHIKFKKIPRDVQKL